MLGEGFEQLTLPLGSDDEGEVVATLVRHDARPPVPVAVGAAARAASGADVLYVHGWSDYFFNPELAHFWSDAGARFFALDLRNYGRSLRPGQTPGYITNLADYDADIEAALTAMGHGPTDAAGASARPLILLGHSTGGLTFSLWTARHPGRAAALVLNSPWLEFQPSRSVARVTPVIAGCALEPEPAAERRPRLLHPLDLEGARRRVGVLARWRPDRGFTAHPAWLTAIFAGHARSPPARRGAPVLTLLSARSTLQPRWDPAMLTTDIVLVVDDIAQRVLKLGPQVTVARIDGALHDVFLSREPARDAAYASVTRWLEGYAPRR